MARSSSLVEMIKGRWREFRREPSAFLFVILMPILWMVILGFAFSSPRPEHFGVAWIEPSLEGRSAGDLIHNIQRNLESDERLELRSGKADEVTTWLRRGEVLLIVEPAPNAVRYRYDPTNPESARARSLVNELVQEAGGRTDPVAVTNETIAIAGTRYVDFLVPGLLALSIMTSSLFGTGMTIVSNRRENLLKRYLATPMNPTHYIISHIIGRGFILVVELAAVLITAYLIFDFNIAGSFLFFLLFAALGTAAFTAFGIMMGSRTSNTASMNGMTNLIVLPMMIVAGVWFSRTNFPDFISEGARYLPLTPLVDGLRKIALEGATLNAVSFEILVLAVYLVVCTIGARILFKWY